MFRLGEVLDWLPNRTTQVKRHSNKLLFRFESEIPPIQQIRLKVEINCMEHFNVMGFQKVPFKVENGWFSGSTELVTYHFEELMGTKLRALYQRKKGRDLFDLYECLRQRDVDADKVMECYKQYMEFVVDRVPSYKEYVQNLELKMHDDEFLTDVEPLIRPEIEYDPNEAYQWVYDNFIERMSGKRD
jgi:predicted nucleotidyltransferase component of viral defense system